MTDDQDEPSDSNLPIACVYAPLPLCFIQSHTLYNLDIWRRGKTMVLSFERCPFFWVSFQVATLYLYTYEYQ